MCLELNGQIKNDNIDLGIVNKETEIWGTDKIFKQRIQSKQEADSRQIFDKYPKSDRDTEHAKGLRHTMKVGGKAEGRQRKRVL